MLWVDTNVLVRFLTHDDPAQASRADALMKRNVRISKTVLLETEWVLRSAYGFEAEVIFEAFTRLAGMRNVSFEDTACIARSMEMFPALEFTDALHLAACDSADEFATFDSRLAKRARNQTAIKVLRA